MFRECAQRIGCGRAHLQLFHTHPQTLRAGLTPQTWQDFVNFGLTGRAEITHFAGFVKRTSTLFAQTSTMHSTRQPNFAALLGLAWLLVVSQLVAQYWTGTAHAFADTDDAMRLAQLRDWLGGQGWFDMRQPRVAGGYETHWSRLIDAGLGGMLWLLSWFATPAFAERLMFTVWPLLWLFPAMAGTAAIAWRVAGREAALVALLMAVIGLPALHQFRPGRIDHHNV